MFLILKIDKSVVL